MFETAELGNAVARSDYEERVPGLRVDLVNAQYDLRHADFPVIVVLSGDDRGGVNEALNLLHEWMDARYLESHAFGPELPEEAGRPRLWRYWQALPRRGGLAIVVGDWAARLLVERATGEIGDDAFLRGLDHVGRFERTLVENGALLLKFWLHLPKKELKRRLKKAKHDDDAALRVDDFDQTILARYDELLPLAEEMLRRTSSALAPWNVVEGTDRRFRDLTVAEGILAALTGRLAASSAAARGPAPPAEVPDLDPKTTVLSSVDLSAALPYDEYKPRLVEEQTRLRRLAARARRKGIATVLVFEGWDAAGKGGVIRRLSSALDARDYRIVPFAAPTEEEKAHHHLWRFWRQLPRPGRIVVYDRSWYGRVLVERVDGLAAEAEWRRAYTEIVDFEEQLVEAGVVLCKFWLHIDREEQLRRFEAREETPYKKYKIGEEDYRNRGKWDDYVAAVDEMIARTSTAPAPWHLVAAKDKRHARVTVLRTVCDALERRRKRR